MGLTNGNGSFDRVRLRLLADFVNRSEGRGMIVALTSRGRKEGVTTVALGLARSFMKANDSKVLIVDSGFSGQRVSQLAKVKAPKPVTAEILQNDDIDLLDECVATTKNGIDVMVMDNTQASKAIAQGQAGKKLLQRVQSRYDVVIVDTGSMQSEAAYLWTSAVDFVLLVVDATRTTIHALSRAGEEFSRIGMKFDGFILNKRTFPIPRFLYNLVS